MVHERASARQGRGRCGVSGEPSGSLQQESAWSNARPSAAVLGPPPGLSKSGPTGSSHGSQQQGLQGSKPQPGAIPSSQTLAKGAWANNTIVPTAINGRGPQRGRGQISPGRQRGRGAYNAHRQEREWQQVPRAGDTSQHSVDDVPNDYSEVQQQLAVPSGRGRGSLSPSRSPGRNSEPSPEPTSRGSGPRGRGVTRTPAGLGDDQCGTAIGEMSRRMQTATITDDLPCAPSPPQFSHYTQEPQHLASLHQQEGIAEMVGQYNPDVSDPSHAMMNLVVRGWDSDKLDHGCRLLQRGIGAKIAARQAGVMVGDLKSHWETYYANVDPDDYEDSVSDGSPIPR